MPGLGQFAAAWTLPAAAGVFLLLAVLETHYPRQDATAAGVRWITNFGLYAAVVGASIVLVPQQLVEAWLGGWALSPFAWLSRDYGSGVTLAVGLLLLDGLAYWLHRLQHLGPLWRLHSVHHADVELDASTGLRHHPGEYLVNVALGGIIVVLVGLPVWVAPAYGLIAMLSDLWTHANLRVPHRLERVIATVIATPGVHRVHHSTDLTHYDTNFGSVLTVWDRIFGTWHPIHPHKLTFGVAGAGEQGLLRALLTPFRPAA